MNGSAGAGELFMASAFSFLSPKGLEVYEKLIDKEISFSECERLLSTQRDELTANDCLWLRQAVAANFGLFEESAAILQEMLSSNSLELASIAQAMLILSHARPAVSKLQESAKDLISIRQSILGIRGAIMPRAPTGLKVVDDFLVLALGSVSILSSSASAGSVSREELAKELIEMDVVLRDWDVLFRTTIVAMGMSEEIDLKRMSD